MNTGTTHHLPPWVPADGLRLESRIPGGPDGAGTDGGGSQTAAARSAPRVLIVDDVSANMQLLIRTLEPQGYELLVAHSGEVALRLAGRARPDLILLDVMMPGLDGIATCSRLKSDARLADVPVIFVTALDEPEQIVRGFEAGGVDYIVKPYKSAEVLARVATHVKLHRLTRELQERNAQLQARTRELEEAQRAHRSERAQRERAEEALEVAGERMSALATREAERWGIAGFAGRSATIRRILEDIRKLHRGGDTSVLITGESGTGKELIARAIHGTSNRARGPFVPVNCVAIPAELAESVLFGHRKGAFTGAIADRKGCFELAHGGTLFLDEIGDMPPGLQAKLLRVLEDGEITPVGSSQPIRTSVRVLAATNVDLQQKIADGRFRADLFYRLARFHVQLPPVRERQGDIELLAQHFVQLFAAEMGVAAPVLSAEVREALNAYRFPGNVRELKNLIERALILAGTGEVRVEHLQFQENLDQRPALPVHSQPMPAGRDRYNLRAVEQLTMQRALDATQGNVSLAARLLGCNRSRIYRVLGSALGPAADDADGGEEG